MSEFDEGYEDIHKPDPYIDYEIVDKVALLVTLYVPPNMRGEGWGKWKVKEFIDSLPKEVTHIRLIACSLATGDTMPFWKSLGFTPAYDVSEMKEPENYGNILVLGVNGCEPPKVEKLEDGCDEVHWFFDAF